MCNFNFIPMHGRTQHWQGAIVPLKTEKQLFLLINEYIATFHFTYVAVKRHGIFLVNSSETVHKNNTRENTENVAKQQFFISCFY